MSQEQKAKMELPPGWKRVNFFSLNLAYCFFVLFVPMQVPSVSKILIKAFSQEVYDTLNGWVLVLLLFTSAGAGILGYARMVSVKKIITLLEKTDDKEPD